MRHLAAINLNLVYSDNSGWYFNINKYIHIPVGAIKDGKMQKHRTLSTELFGIFRAGKWKMMVVHKFTIQMGFLRESHLRGFGIIHLLSLPLATTIERH